MDDQKYDSAVNYCGKWCLYQPTPSSSVICIFIDSSEKTQPSLVVGMNRLDKSISLCFDIVS